jgi:hypothetical protein
VEVAREIKIINTIILQDHTCLPCYFVNSTIIREIHNGEIFKRSCPILPYTACVQILSFSLSAGVLNYKILASFQPVQSPSELVRRV